MELLDIIALLKSYLVAQWSETDPAAADLKWQLGYSEFDKIGALPVKALKGSPIVKIQDIPEARARATFVTTDTYRIEHEVLITVYIRPVKYDDTTMDAKATTFRKLKTEIDNILKAGRYSITGVITVDLTGWKDETDPEASPIVFISKQIVKAVYYE